MQFMSQSMGWADDIILAMAPLGIVTAIVAAIRVGGPSWLRAVIGRARENLAVSEAELMSSTSKEVCEVWNGQEVVRCMGLAPVVEFIC
jgi:CYTH domain-containing protein